MQSRLESNHLALVVDEFLMLVQETADFQRDARIRGVLEEAARVLLRARRKLQRSAHRYVVAMVGLTNVGKSTLLNALLGNDLAPRRNRPCTAAPIEFAYGNTYRVTAYHLQQLHRPTWMCDGVEDVHERLAALADDSGGETPQSVQRIVVEAPLPLLENGLIIADTPGFGAAQLAGTHDSHEASLRGYLKESVAQVLWVVLAEQGIGNREKSFHDEFFAEVCDDVVVTGCEDWSRPERERFRRRFAQCFAQRLPTFHFVSGLAGLHARAANDADRLDAAGIPFLESRIRELAEPAGRNAAIQRTVVQLAEDIAYWMRESVALHDTATSTVWRPDSWDRWISSLPEGALGRSLATRLQLSD